MANHLLKRCRDFAQVSREPINLKNVKQALALLGIDELGLNQTDRQILETIITKFAGGPVGLNTIATALSEEDATIEDVNEPYLIQVGLLERTARGRVVTPRAYEHLGFDLPDKKI
jgi:Holliday junction DNA helicase RuvB